MDTRRERRQRAADDAIGRRHMYFYGAPRGLLVGLLAVLALAAGAVGWAVAPDTMEQATRWALGIVGSLLLGWVFWYVGIRRR